MKKTISIFAAAVLTLTMSMTAFAGSWQKNNTGWWYQNDNGSWPAACWQQINGAWYYFNEAGYMLENTMTPDGFYVGPDGAWVQNGQAARNTQQEADTSALGERYHYAYSLDAAGGQYNEGLPDLFILVNNMGDRQVTFGDQSYSLYMHPRTNGTVYGRVYGEQPDVQIFYEGKEGKGNVTLYYNGHKSVYTR